MKCTWQDCNEKAIHPQIAKDGDQWANLCNKHHKQLDVAIGEDSSILLWTWSKAGGGSKVMPNRIMTKLILDCWTSY